ncbi:SCO1664 family protein [Rhodococcus sp. BP-252]|uniref:SCO1664 family protein n=1 Tax=unclassified Rhodococcus (in: high G+C Gram-positive bacteria) TaxID=192944 RepID=UPI001C9B59C0|nr:MULTISPECIES: SCO1664 family protein [unclassified Rhodococcus (in: high G+C Gram-positive bacteria)]MBY6410050.1 SCO1664 family protein [Rhodococcus sp. BP-320]MBY6415019.1 SCO1664 family protein [Rhodococcus sp. BP-321]MBY6421278.1 SCO1664 family protein [Rhodococcus sp. BP-324]MBY6425673.1 SCO1664 family protein [Rhodococcus sp. BP-323]MBY6429915.1 SCO1664 family protein [Rhodococcus sp. BP-322]
METGELTVVGRVVSASNATLVCEATLDGDASGTSTASSEPVRCVYKPIRGEVPLWDFPDGTLAGREIASYEISDALGWGVIPTTILRDGPFGPGMVQRWIDTPEPHGEDGTRIDLVDLCPPELVPEGWIPVLQAYDGEGQEVALIHADDPRLQRMAVLDVLLNNADRKGGHALEGLDGYVYGVDHGICLHSEDKLRTVLWGWSGRAIDDASMSDIVEFVDTFADAVEPRLRGHITEHEIDALLARARGLIARPVMPEPRSSRPIPWPAF